MAGGGIYDRVEGGFFRYSTRPDWSAPHYEKMLELNAGMIKNYADASLVLHKSDYIETVRGTIGYIMANLYDTGSGLFYGSQDADEEYYKGDDRDGLSPPYIDMISYTDSTSLMISALLSAYNATGEEEYLRISERAAGFIIKKLYQKEDGVFHYFRDSKGGLRGMLSDNVLFGSALIDLYNVTGNRKYTGIAGETGRILINRFYNKERRQFRPFLDTTIVSPATSGMLLDFNTVLQNYRTLYFLSRLHHINRDDELNSPIESTIKRFAGTYEGYEPYASLFGTVLRWRLDEPLEVTIISEEDGYREHLSALRGMYIPEKVVRVFSLKSDADTVIKEGYPLKEVAFVCVGKRCSPPLTTPKALKGEIFSFLSTSPGH